MVLRLGYAKRLVRPSPDVGRLKIREIFRLKLHQGQGPSLDRPLVEDNVVRRSV